MMGGWGEPKAPTSSERTGLDALLEPDATRFNPSRILVCDTTPAIAGVDPGQSGAIAILDADTADLVDLIDMPYLDGTVIVPELADFLRRHRIRTVWVERAQSMPNQSSTAMFKYGVGYGAILGAVGTLELPLQTVRPHTWKAKAGVTKDKGSSRRAATELWPTWSASFARVKDDGRAEAALIARHGLLLERGAA